MIVYADGGFREKDEAFYPLEERGVLFADGVYEVVRYDRGRPFEMDAHVRRLRASLAGIGLPWPGVEAAASLSDELVRRNGLPDARVYWQVTRSAAGGPGKRSFVHPEKPEPAITMIAYPAEPLDPAAPVEAGEAVIVEDVRWHRCGIKSLMLLPASMAKTEAKRRGAVEALFERAKPGAAGTHITEGSSTNAFAVIGGVLRTHPADGWVLAGVTRAVLLEAARSAALAVEERAFTRAELLAASEAFACSTTQVTALTSVEGTPIGGGKAGEVTRRLAAAYVRRVLGA
ncbi:aminotransferase class IV [Phycisphaera mikurensis]|uniref:D-amino acid aminotransferase n=1 Tax=Phycisphaera mikurensis (strain NBRC 102666 / KCTC 22515 / FYK2301M01) TaxID=1142394 RepID=I0IF46_PHYMF|nr:aminotransferase class IV [Phycisphaera mikurensis]MBB6440720.1 D-alanine transaminase [Phycisphaera mikurensis]BAM03884.1 D-amino acid aminotransferase [Phycisphaera mikurensis NBRC 102666]